MNMRYILYGVLGLGVLVGLIAIGSYIFFLIESGSGEASEEISAPTLAVPTTEVAEATEEPAATEEADPTEEPTAEMTDEPMVDDATEEPMPTEEPTAEMTEEPAAAAVTGPQLFRIVSEESQARFRIMEVLNGSDFEVVGVTDQVAGDIILDPANPAASTVGTIRINVRTLQTDSSNRDRAIRGFILNSAEDEFEFAEFVPTALENMPDSVAVGDTFTFDIIGDFTISGDTTNVTFEATVTAVAADRIEGLATLTIPYADLGISIPRLPPQVASVEDDVIIELDFVATEVSE